MSTHTPGPWEISEQYIIARSKRGLRTICQWRSYSDEANARLIAAAPDLLAALRKMVAHFEADIEGLDEDDEADEKYRAFQQARAAIAKAESTS